MTELLKLAIEALEHLSEDEQDLMARRILDDLEDERAWGMRFADPTNQQKMQRMAKEALEEHRRGDTEEWP